jgi:flagellar hook-length control protein FliK
LTEVQEKTEETKQLEKFDLGKSTSIIDSPAKGKSNSAKTFSGQLKDNTQNQPNTLTHGSSIDKFQVSDMQVSASQTRYRGDLSFNRSSNLEIEQILSSNSTNVHTTLQSSSPNQAAATTINSSAGLGQQVLESMYASLGQQGRQITIQLNPPELGRIFIRCEQHQDEITCVLQVSRQQTRTEIEQVLPSVTRVLQDSGVHIRRVDVILADQQERQLDRESSFPQDSYQQNDFQQAGSADDNSAHNGATIDISNEKDKEAQMRISPNSIDMLV